MIDSKATEEAYRRGYIEDVGWFRTAKNLEEGMKNSRDVLRWVCF